MKLFGLHWSWHLLYLAALSGLAFWGKNRLTQTAFVKNELSEVQRLTLPEINRSAQTSFRQIDKVAYAYPAPRYEQMYSSAKRALTLVRSFDKKSDEVSKSLREGTLPHKINWHTALLDDFYRLGDSLSAIYGLDSARQSWLERCLFSGYRSFPPERLASMLTTSDTADALRLCQNLQFRAELALLLTLETLREKMQIHNDIRFDGLIPVLAPEGCPRAGVPFKAEIFLAAYSSNADNVTIKVNGELLKNEAGLGRYAKTFSNPGEHKLPVEIQVRNPLTGEVKTYGKDFFTFIFDTTEVR